MRSNRRGQLGSAVSGESWLAYRFFRLELRPTALAVQLQCSVTVPLECEVEVADIFRAYGYLSPASDSPSGGSVRINCLISRAEGDAASLDNLLSQLLVYARLPVPRASDDVWDY